MFLRGLINCYFMIYHDDLCLNHNIPYEFAGNQTRTYPEVRERIDQIISVLLANDRKLSNPKVFDPSWISQIHHQSYVDFILSIDPDLDPIAPTIIKTGGQLRENSSFYAKLGHYFFDPATPIMGQTPKAARAAVNVALSATNALLNNQSRAYALCRPPGHHARSFQGGGYCIFNNVAIAANFLSQMGKSVTILDLDYHHGNGTQELMYHREDVQYVSLHADPTTNYPFYWGWKDQIGIEEGRGFTANHPLPNTTNQSQYLDELKIAIKKIDEYQPDMVLVSMGFDCYIDDPIAGMNLTTTSYYEIGKLLHHFPKVGVVLEGGYHIDSIGENFYHLYKGLEGI